MMARWMKRLLLVALALALLCAVAGGVLAALGVGTAGPLGSARIEINGDEISLAQLHGGHWLAAAAGLALALLVAMVVLPVALLVPLLAVVLVLVLVLGVLAGVMALLLSPLLVVAGLCWLTWRLARGGRRPAAVRSSDHAESPPIA
jgi:hypothetical protein